jgi:hypothetical protein
MHKFSKRFFEQMDCLGLYKVREESEMLQIQFEQKIKRVNRRRIIKHGIRECVNIMAIE